MGNPEIDQLMNRRSVRAFSGETVSDDDLATILRAAQQAPTSVNGQQVSLIVTRDKSTIRRIADIAGGQVQVATADVFVTIVVDFNRTAHACQAAGVTQQIADSAEGLMVGAVDAGIMLMALQVAAESLGYGTTAIGGIRRAPQALVELLGLPAGTFPLVGTTIGVPDKTRLPRVKPRVPLSSFAMHERYDDAAVAAGVTEYDRTLAAWWQEQGITDMPSYCRATAGYYQSDYFPTVGDVLARQGFSLADK